MKYYFALILMLSVFCGCTNLQEDWGSSGAEAQKAYQEQRYQEQVESVRKQVPEARPNF